MPGAATGPKRTLGWRLGKRAFLLLLAPGLGIYLALIVYPFITSVAYGFYNGGVRFQYTEVW